jgi:anti-anti-sigma factor
MTDFSYSVEPNGAHAIGHLAGEIDLATIAALEAAIEATEEACGDGDVVLDMSGVTFIDSSGLRVLVTANDRQDASDRRLIIRNPSVSVLRVLEITGLLSTMNIDE